MQNVAIAFEHLAAGVIAVVINEQRDIAMALADHVAAGAFGGESVVVALIIDSGNAETVKGDHVARRLRRDGAEHHHRHALAL